MLRELIAFRTEFASRLWEEAQEALSVPLWFPAVEITGRTWKRAESNPKTDLWPVCCVLEYTYYWASCKDQEKNLMALYRNS